MSSLFIATTLLFQQIQLLLQLSIKHVMINLWKIMNLMIFPSWLKWSHHLKKKII